MVNLIIRVRGHGKKGQGGLQIYTYFLSRSSPWNCSLQINVYIIYMISNKGQVKKFVRKDDQVDIIRNKGFSLNYL